MLPCPYLQIRAVAIYLLRTHLPMSLPKPSNLASRSFPPLLQTSHPGPACMLSHFSCVLLFDPVDCSPPGFSVHGIIQARILEQVAIPSSRGSFWPRGWLCISYISCIGNGFFTTSVTWEAHPGPAPRLSKPHLGDVQTVYVIQTCARIWKSFLSPMLRYPKSH